MTPTCTHIHDDGRRCDAVAVSGQKFCSYHVRHRARLLRMAQNRARSERFNLTLPPLEDMFAVQSALDHLVEAVAADMLDLKRAHFLLKAVRSAAQNLKWADKWPASIAYSAEPASMGAPPLSPALGDRVGFIDLAAEYGLPHDLDLSTPPEVAFPPPRESHSTGGPQLPDLGNCGNTLSSSDDIEVLPDDPVSPEMVEVMEVANTLGSDAAAIRGNQLERNRQLRELRADRKRYAKIALQHNLRRAAEKLAARKLAEQAALDKLADQSASAAKKPPTPAAGQNIDRKEAAIA